MCGALEHAGLQAADRDEIALSHFIAGFSYQSFTASPVLQVDSAFRFKPVTDVENACATGFAAIYQVIKSVRACTAKKSW